MVDPDPPRGGVLQATENVATSVVASLRGTPTLLVMVVLNIAMIAAAAWFLDSQETHRHEERKLALDTLTRCFKVPQ